jgi:hypothetical protein
MPLPMTKIFFFEFDGLKEGAIVVANVLVSGCELGSMNQ